MTERYIKTSADDQPQLRVFENNIGGNLVSSQAISIVDAAGNVMTNLDGSGMLQVNASGAAIPVTDNGGSITVDAPVGTPIAVRLSDGTSFLATLPISGTVTAATVKSATTAASAATVNTTSSTLLASNSNRLGASIYNNGGRNIYVRLGTPASTASFTVVISTGSYYEIPFSYTGIITAVTNAGSTSAGGVLVTEFTA